MMNFIKTNNMLNLRCLQLNQNWVMTVNENLQNNIEI